MNDGIGFWGEGVCNGLLVKVKVVRIAEVFENAYSQSIYI